MDRLKQILNKKDVLRRAELLCSILESEECGRVALVPSVANFQLPEIFLSTKILPECETYFMQESTEIKESEIKEWNTRVDNTIEKMANEFVISNAVTNKPTPSEAEIEERIKYVLGYE
ncbi:hypothetical protein NEMIN01_1128 [Nematocida minor]|uniref:uncharacterized protein n=1 Tax=Nematocida minor TaxID=1912983 RepID=UPI00221EDA93|nr:uncharacterized protein NEMIN01_1128 [Nematocida minor]KAI5190663.1 hypothetical protein NEMIN01_1128 [Nematocida minor]